MVKQRLVVCVGTQKAGTTSLYGLMQQHPLVSVTKKKETGFFYNENVYSKGYNWFLKEYFSANGLDKVLFEADPNYMYFPICIERIYQCNPETQLIIMLRNPADRAFSHYMMMRRWCLEELSFEEACRAEPDRVCKGEWEKADFGYVERSRYADQISFILNVFPREQVFFVLFEEFTKDQQAVFNRILYWLGLPVKVVNPLSANVASHPRNKLVTKLLHRPEQRPLRKAVGKVLGGNKKLNYKIGALIEKLNQTAPPLSARPKLNPQVRKEIMDNIASDIHKVEVLTGLNVTGAWLK